MTCPLQLDLVAFAKGELSPSEQEAVRAHLPSCVDCQEELDAVEELLGGIAALPSVRPSEDFAARVTRALSANPEYVKLAKETRRREKEETIRRHGWMTWAGKSLRERMSSAPGWVAAAAVYLVTFGVLAWVLIPRDEKPSQVVTHEEPGKTAVAPPRGGSSDGQTAITDPLAPGGKLLLVESRTSEAARKQVTDEVAKAIGRGLVWLVSQQGEDGSWSKGSVEATALATLALLGDAHRSGGGKHQGTVARAIGWLRGKQGENGAFDQDPYAHALATIAVIEDLAFGVEDKADTSLARKSLESAIGFCRSSQYEDGSWGEMEATAKNCEALRQAQALGEKGCKIPLDRAGAYLAKSEPARDIGAWRHGPWRLACAWTGTLRGEYGPADGEPPKVTSNGLAPRWWWADAGLVFGRPCDVDGLVPQQNDDGSWKPESADGDATASTALHVLILETPYRVAPLPKAK